MRGTFFKNKKNRFHISMALIGCLVLTLLAPGNSVAGLFSEGSADDSSAVRVYAAEKAATSDPTPLGGKTGYAVVHDYRTGISDKPAISSRKATSTDPYQNTYVDALGEMMSSELDAAFGNSAGTQAVISTVSPSSFTSYGYYDINSSVTFTFSSSILPSSSITSQDMLYYVEQAISRYPKLCCLFTLLYISIYNSQATLTVYSPVAKSDMQRVVLEYETALSDMLKVPNSNTGMKSVEKLLYIHDEVVAMSEYSYRQNYYALDHVPAGTMLYGVSVCQAYAAVFNHAARKLGLISYVIDSTSHAWNAVYLDGYWYYVDTTWDDTSINTTDAVNHQYFMVSKSKFSTGHDMDSEYSAAFSGIESNMGTSYDSYLPRQNNITSQMGYTGGYFYFVQNNNAYRWNGTDSAERISSISAQTSRRINVVNGIVYFSGGDGMYRCNSTMTQATRVNTTAYTGMYEALNKLYVTTGGSWYIYLDSSTPVVTPSPTPAGMVTATPSNSPDASGSPTPTPAGGIETLKPPSFISPSVSPSASPSATSSSGASATPYPTATAKVTATPKPTGTASSTSLKTPGRVTIKSLTNVKTRSMKVSWSKPSNTTRFRVQYSTSKNFTTKSTRDILTSPVTINNLFKNKTYYVRVRAVKIGYDSAAKKLIYKYGKWSKVKKVKITK